MDGALTAVLHMQHAPAWMHRSHPVGVAGKDAAAKGAVIFNAEGEGLIPVSNAKARFQEAGKAINFVALRDWFLPRYKAYKADPSKSVTVADVAAIMSAPSTWVDVAP